MLRKPFHGWRIKLEIQKLTAVRTPPVRESPGSPTPPTPLTSLSPLPPLFFYCRNFPPTSHFRSTHQSFSTSAAYYPRPPEPERNTHLEDPNLNVESLRESFDDGRENNGDGEGFCRRRTPPEKRVSILTCVRDGKCSVFCFWTKHNSQELSTEETLEFTYVGSNLTVASSKVLWYELETIPGLIQNVMVLNRLEVFPRDLYDAVMKELKEYHFMPAKEQVGNKLEVLRHWSLVAYEEAMKNGVGVMMNRCFPVLVALCDRRPLSQKIAFIRTSLTYYKNPLRFGHRGKRFSQARFSRLWRLCVLQLLMWIQSGTYFGWVK